MQLSIETNFKDVARQLKTLEKDIASKATASALNKVVAQAKTAMSKEIRGQFNMKAKDVNEFLGLRKATARSGLSALEAVLFASPKPGKRGFNVIRFSARQTKRGVSVTIKRASGRTTVRESFIANAGRTVFRRTGEPKRVMTKGFNAGKLREPIKAVSTIDVSQMFNTKRINAKVVQMIEAKFPTIFANEVRYFAERFNSRAG
jgi:hypothetical protein